MASDPEELLRSIERTREELALTVDTIAGRLDPKVAAKRGIGKVRSGVTGVVEGARLTLGIGNQVDEGDRVMPAAKRVPKPVIGGGLAALLAFAAVLAVRRRRQ